MPSNYGRKYWRCWLILCLCPSRIALIYRGWQFLFSPCLVPVMNYGVTYPIGSIRHHLLTLTYNLNPLATILTVTAVVAFHDVVCRVLVPKRIRLNWKIQSWWRHQMKKICVTGPLRWGIHKSPGDSPRKGQWRRALMFSLICTWTNGWANNRDAVDMRCHRAYYDVTVMVAAGMGVTAFVSS